ncbi:Glucose-repressible alcohol dehydrogenase transcriptional effector [Gonapodya sp. JEL0774]|nr:Glucose-repressible alcohol dehydrogenase transcriptional effector [Gonapodya sp. JEL0774]
MYNIDSSKWTESSQFVGGGDEQQAAHVQNTPPDPNMYGFQSRYQVQPGKLGPQNPYLTSQQSPSVPSPAPIPSLSTINGGNVVNAPHITRQLEQAQASRQSAAPHHHSRISRTAVNLGIKANDFSSPFGGSVLENGGSSTPGPRYGTPSLVQARAASSQGSFRGSGTPIQSQTPASGSANSSQNNVALGDDTKASQWTTLDLGGMAIRNLSRELFRYTFLSVLYINHNSLSSLPPQISNLRSLVQLDVSGNKLTTLPPELGLVVSLKELLAFDNQIATLPPELGFLYQLENLGLEGNPIQEPLLSIMQKEGTPAVTSYLRDNCPAIAPPPEREWVYVEDDTGMTTDSFTVLTYNVLCERYATSSSYQYVPSWALSWEFRRQNLIQEIVGYNADILCLQEIEYGQFDDFFQPELREHGYDGTFYPKSRIRVMADYERKYVDGCATFWKSARFAAIEKNVIEFQRLPMERPEFRKTDDLFNRVTLRDNIATIVFLESKETHARVIVANTHLHWDPQFRDVKLLQTSMLIDEVQRISRTYASLNPRHPLHAMYSANSSKLPLLIVGDLNSTPDSGVYEFMSKGSIAPDHEDFLSHSYYNTEGPVTHTLGIKSAYAHMAELSFTNFTPHFKDAIDYIWYTSSSLQVAGVLGNVDPAYVDRCVGFPNWHHPSDHIPVLAEFRWKGLPTSGTGVGSGGAGPNGAPQPGQMAFAGARDIQGPGISAAMGAMGRIGGLGLGAGRK